MPCGLELLRTFFFIIFQQSFMKISKIYPWHHIVPLTMYGLKCLISNVSSRAKAVCDLFVRAGNLDLELEF